VYNEWTINTAGWIDQYGVDILTQNAGKATHTVSLAVNGVTKDTFTAVPNNTGIFWQNITPLIVLAGNVIRVTAQISQSGNNYWYQQTGLFGSAPVYCSAAVGSKDGAAAGTTAYGVHLLFQPGTKSADWDIVAFGGAAAGGGGIGEAPTDGQQYGRQNAAWTVVPPPGAPPSSLTDLGSPAGNSTIDTASAAIIAVNLLWTTAANWTLTLQNVIPSAQFYLRLRNNSGAARTFTITATNPSAAAYTVTLYVPGANPLTGAISVNNGNAINASGIAYTVGASPAIQLFGFGNTG
jgi:hypothetical protein